MPVASQYHRTRETNTLECHWKKIYWRYPIWYKTRQWWFNI